MGRPSVNILSSPLLPGGEASQHVVTGSQLTAALVHISDARFAQTLHDAIAASIHQRQVLQIAWWTWVATALRPLWTLAA